jgi:hypothetical protein
MVQSVDDEEEWKENVLFGDLSYEHFDGLLTLENWKIHGDKSGI